MRDLEFVDPVQLLKEIRASVRGPWPPSRGCAASGSGASDGAAAFFRGVSPAVDAILRRDTALRMECIKALREHDSLTVQETAQRLGMEPAAVKSQFLKLRQLGLIEPAGCRKTAAGVQASYRLNVRNPALEFVLAPGPEGMCSPHEVAERRRSRERDWARERAAETCGCPLP